MYHWRKKKEVQVSGSLYRYIKINIYLTLKNETVLY